MRHLLRLAGLGLMAGVLTLLTSGCGFALSPEDLYSLPALPAEYTELNSCINQMIDSGAEYAAPVSGTNIQPVQMKDLDGDGQQEAVAFFRNSSDEKPLKICIYTAEGDTYEQTAVIEGSGTAIYSIEYSDLDNDGRQELIVGWRVSTDAQALTVYSLRSDQPEELMRTNYVKYAITDLDQDQLLELVVLRSDEEGNGLADYYRWQEGMLSLQSYARISSTMAELSGQQGRVQKGMLADQAPALFITGVEDAAWAITDILTVREGELCNLLLSDVTGVSGEIVAYHGLYPMDINGDGIMELPQPITVSAWDGGTWSTYQWVNWRIYDSEGKETQVLNTYHNMEDGWYLELPEQWRGNVLISRTVGLDEVNVTFSILDNNHESEPQPFLQITTLTGSSREIKATRGGRIILRRQVERIFTAELLEPGKTWEYGITEDEVREAFNLITTEWMTGDN